MTNKISINIRPLPSPRPRVYNNRAVMPKAYIEHKDIIKAHCRSFTMLKGAIKATLRFHFKTPKALKRNKYSMPVGDNDNLAKSVLDALEGVAYENDRQVTELIVKKGYSDTDLIEILLEELDIKDK